MVLNPDAADMTRFLEVLGQECQGETASQLSMFAIGEKLGLDRDSAGRLGEEIIAQGWAEVRTLAGDIGLTAAGVEYLAESTTPKGDATPSLGTQSVLDESGAAYLDRLVAELKMTLGQSGIDFEALAEVVADLRSLDAQLASPRIKTAIIRVILEDIVQCLAEKLSGQIIPRIKQFVA